MTPYQSDLPVTPGQLEAIGLVAAEWSYLESVMDAAIWTLSGVRSEDIGAAVTTHLAFELRLEMLAALWEVDSAAARFLSHTEAQSRREEFIAVRQMIDSLSAKRDDLVHARWFRGEQGSPLIYTVTARGVLTRQKHGMPEPAIRDLARQISECSRCMKALFGIEETAETGE